MRSLLLAVVLGLAATSAKAQSEAPAPERYGNGYGRSPTDVANVPQVSKTDGAKNRIVGQQILINVTYLEFEPEAASKIAAANEIKDPLKELIKKASESSLVRTVAAKHGDLKKSLASLQQVGLARVIAEPTLVTIDGGPGSFSSGGEIVLQKTSEEPAGKRVEFGTSVEVTPRLTGDDRVQLDLNAKVIEVEQVGNEADERHDPLLRRRQISASVELKLGQTLVVGGVSEQRINARDSSVQPAAGGQQPRVALYLISVEKVDAVIK